MSFKAPSVIKRHGGRFALVVKEGRTLLQVVEMANQKLVMRGHSCEDLKQKGYQSTEINPFETAKRFLNHSAGLTANASEALQTLIDDAFLY